jgi:hypothetical protein
VTDPARRRRRRAVGPTGAAPAQESRLDLAPEASTPRRDDDERLTADRPPHHDRGV